MQKIYMAGVGGMLGEAFYKVFNTGYELKCTDIAVNEEWLSYLDFRDLESYKNDVRDFQPDYLFHIGAHTSLEYCEDQPEDAYSTNTLAVENAVLIANSLDIPLLYISTAGIFDGKKQLYDDWDTPNPLGVYARSKFMGERYVVENARRFLVCRAGWMMGSGPAKDKKFIQKLMSQLKAGNTELNIVNDKDGTPTYTVDFAKNCELLLRSECWGLYNMVCGGETSRLEVAKKLVDILGLNERIKINEVDSSFFSKEYHAERPPNERLKNTKLELRSMNQMNDWEAALEEYIADYYCGYLE